MSSVLHDTGVHIPINNEWQIPGRELDKYPVHELLDEPDSLRIQWGNQTDIPFSKYTVVNLCIGEGEDKCHLDGSFLITTDQISNPILGFNAIKHIVQKTKLTINYW